MKSKKTKGFTLIEAVASMLLLSFFTLGICLFMKPITDLWVLQSFQHDTALEAKLGLMRMMRDLEEVSGRGSITQAAATALDFTDSNDLAISYSLSSGTLLRNNVALIKGVSSLSIQYIGFTAGGADTVLASPTLGSNTNIRRINVTLTVTARGQSATFRSQVEPRNLY